MQYCFMLIEICRPTEQIVVSTEQIVVPTEQIVVPTELGKEMRAG